MTFLGQIATTNRTFYASRSNQVRVQVGSYVRHFASDRPTGWQLRGPNLPYPKKVDLKRLKKLPIWARFDLLWRFGPKMSFEWKARI